MSAREDLYVDGVSGKPICLYVGRDELLDYRLVDADGVPEDASVPTITVDASIELDATPGTYTNVTGFSVVIAPDQTVGSATRGIFQLVIPNTSLTAAPGWIYGDIIVDNRVRAPWKARVVSSKAVGV